MNTRSTLRPTSILARMGLALVGVASMAMIAVAPVRAEDAPKSAPAPATAPADTKDGTKDGTKDTTKDAKKDEKKDEKKDAKPVTAGSVAPAFTLKDTDGKEHSLAELTKSGKVVVIQWFNPDCPFVVKHYRETKTFNNLAEKYKDKNVQFLAINSGAAGKQGAGLERNKKAKTDWAIPYPILLDESGEIGKAYGAKRTPEMFIVNKDGVIAYHGAIDDDSGADTVGKTNYVEKALDEILAGTSVTTATTRPYGCTVKYAAN
jgi:peroxiredoxin